VLAVASIYAATMVLFVLANKRTTSANAIFLQSTAPLWVLLAGPALLGERTTDATCCSWASWRSAWPSSSSAWTRRRRRHPIRSAAT
jgi:hypothetical protein